MSAPIREFRARTPRREVRLGCWVTLEGKRARGVTSDLSEGGASLQLAVAGLAGLELGARLSLRLVLDAGAPLEGLAEVVWLDPDDRDVRDQRVLGVGVEFVGLEAEERARLATFLRDFRPAVLVLEDDPEYSELYQSLCEQYRLRVCATMGEALQELESSEVSVLLLGERLPETDCLGFLKTLSEKLPNAKASRVVISEYTVAGQLQTLANLGRLFSFLRKPFGSRELHQTVQRAADAYVLATRNSVLLHALERANERLQRENAYLRQRFVGAAGFEQLIGRSVELKRATDGLSRVQRTDTTVHLQGETGTGKELFARALHVGGRRASGPFVVQNCAGLGEGLMASTFFGYTRGAFTGAERDHPGIFQRASGGTLFLDEVSELSHAAQAALLRVLQEGEVVPLGGTATKVDVRIVSASNKDLREEVKEGRFREDLFFRLVVVPIRVPPLRERKGDISILALHFLDLHCERRGKDLRGFTYEAMRALERHAWPGNVRELANEIERVAVLAEDEEKVHLEHLSSHLRPARPEAEGPVALTPALPGAWVPKGLHFDEAVAHLERTLVREALEKSGGNVSQAALKLGMERSRLAKLRLRLGL